MASKLPLHVYMRRTYIRLYHTYMHVRYLDIVLMQYHNARNVRPHACTHLPIYACPYNYRYVGNYVCNVCATALCVLGQVRWCYVRYAFSPRRQALQTVGVGVAECTAGEKKKIGASCRMQIAALPYSAPISGNGYNGLIRRRYAKYVGAYAPIFAPFWAFI